MATYYPPSSEQMYAHNGGMGGGPPPYHIPPHYHPHPAPRQRTAIACRYCRRRKIRCSGFETSPDGRCANCLRFNQECVFTPVSSQTQAFIPAHAVGRQGILYGPQGQPLPANYAVQNQGQGMEYAPGPSAHAAHPPHRLPSPPGSQNEPRYMYQDDPNRRPMEGGLPPPPLGQSGPPTNPAAPPPPFARRTSSSDYTHYGNSPTSPSSHLPSPRHHAYSPPPVNGPSSFGQGPPPLQAVPGSFGPAPLTINTQRQPDSPSASSFHSVGDNPSVSPQPQPFHPPMVYPPRPTSTGPTSGHSIPSMQIADLIDSPGPSQGPQPPNANQRAAADGAMLDKLMPRKGL